MAALTIFTPAYNRAHTLPRTYDSLVGQNCKDFIWLIVDDGSQDNTAEMVRQWQTADNGFEIRYVYKENGGMHTAHNLAYALIDTELNTCIDSDDALAPGAVKKILEKWNRVKALGYAGMIALNADFDGNVIGKGFPDGMVSTTLTEYYAGGGFGDKKLIYRTDVVKQYPPYPVFEGERYVGLAYLYRQIDQAWNLAVLNDVVCNVEYQLDGHTSGMWREYVRSPRGFAEWRKLCMRYPISTKRLVMDCVHYVSSSLIAGNKRFITESPKKVLTILCIAPGWILCRYTRRKAK